MKGIRQKLKGNKGETLAEAMVASLLAGIALLVLSTMIMVSHRMIDNSSNAVKEFYEGANEIERESGAFENGTVTITGSDHKKTQIEVKIYKTEESGLAVYTK